MQRLVIPTLAPEVAERTQEAQLQSLLFDPRRLDTHLEALRTGKVRHRRRASPWRDSAHAGPRRLSQAGRPTPQDVILHLMEHAGVAAPPV